MNKLKVCVYTISLNEIKHVERFAKSCKDADEIVVCDTGSTDGTFDKLLECGITAYKISIKPWRFDIARNTALSLVSKDIDLCISMDLDEVIQDGWRDLLEEEWHLKKGLINKVNYDYIWSWKEDGSTPNLAFTQEKIHSRFEYYWKYPCHEVLVFYGKQQESFSQLPISIHHKSDLTKSRGHYLDLLELGVKENPEDTRACFYYARELLFHSKNDLASQEFKRYLSLEKSVWHHERAAAMRYLSKIEKDKTEYWLLKASQEDPESKEAIIELSKYYLFEAHKYELAYAYILKSLEIQRPNYGYFKESFSYDETAFDIAALAAYNMGLKQKAYEYGQIALDMKPLDSRLAKNLEYYKD